MIEPSGFVSRLMTFVLAGCLIVLIALIAALTRMFPLERTQVFFLSAEPASEQVVSIEKLDINQQNLKIYKENFIKEYIVARNRIIPSNAAMQHVWDTRGLVYNYSSIEVYQDFKKTDFWYAIMVGKFEPLTFRCDVSFGKIAPRELDVEPEKYAVDFVWICTDESTGQSDKKDFTIALSLKFQSGLNWNERLDNPLGLKVVGYEVESGDGDPLNVLGR
ncbi:MAG: type IV secretion system protein [Rickettsiales bacterium]|jgi:type IV secretory pathway component VirB8|nr:type IV secretion system protein [Rickettsiales bacterium]